MRVTCDTCFYRCSLAEGRTGKCRARINSGGNIVPLNYGRLTALALDPIEKKPLYRFFPGSMILSAGSFGCNMHCPFCQNAEISQSGGDIETRRIFCAPSALHKTGNRREAAIIGRRRCAYNQIDVGGVHCTHCFTARGNGKRRSAVGFVRNKA